MMMEASSSETSVNMHQSTRHIIPEDGRLHTLVAMRTLDIP
jgi:hypothetical protein